ncbi:MAG: hypothetical protein M3T96_07925 [Acidobacteriota bacterium]|nr:hypothetical protein [Acidobacteriota bacterium]
MKSFSILLLIMLSATFAFAQSKSAAAMEKQLKNLQADKVYALKYDVNSDNSKVYGFGADFGDEQDKRNAVESMRFGMAFNYAGRDLKAVPDEYLLTFQAQTKRAKFVEKHGLIFTVDGAILDLGAARYAAKSGIEYLNFKLTREQLGKLAKGREVSLQIGDAAFALSAEQRKLFADLYALSDPNSL